MNAKFWPTKRKKNEELKRNKNDFVYDCCMQTRHLSSEIPRRGRGKNKIDKIAIHPRVIHKTEQLSVSNFPRWINIESIYVGIVA